MTVVTGESRWAIRDVRAVVPTGIVHGATVIVEDGRIQCVDSGGPPPNGAVDGRGLLLLPGLVDTHSDGLEKERQPRRTVRLPVDFSLRSFEGRLRSAGVTTAFHGIGFQHKPDIGRTIALANEVCEEIDARSRGHRAAVEHRVLFRLEARSSAGVDPIRPWLETMGRAVERNGPVPPLVSFEDHTPGQGQYRDVEQFKAAVEPSSIPAGQTLDAYVADILAEADAMANQREVTLAGLTTLVEEGRIRMLAHDCEDAEGVAAMHRAGATIAEFPLSVSAAQAAREREMDVVMGAPNALRGGSHSGNVAAAELVRLGLCDVLASDYLPSTMLAAVFELARTGACALHDAIGLITSGPARAAGLHDRGRLETGAAADLVLVDDSGRWPEVLGVRRAADAALLGVLT